MCVFVMPCHHLLPSTAPSLTAVISQSFYSNLMSPLLCQSHTTTHAIPLYGPPMSLSGQQKTDLSVQECVAGDRKSSVMSLLHPRMPYACQVMQKLCRCHGTYLTGGTVVGIVELTCPHEPFISSM